MRASKPRSDRPERVLVACFALAVLAFAASSTLTSLRLRSVSVHSRDISASAMPRVLELATLRQDLHKVDDDIGAEVDAQRPGDDDLMQRLGALDAQAAAYSRRSDAVRGADVWRQASRSIAATVSGAREVRGALTAGDAAGARAKLDAVVRPSAAAADTDLWRLVQSTATEGVEAARRIDAIRGEADALSIALDASCALLSALLAALALRATRRHTRFMEARAEDLEQFAVRVAHDLRGPLQPVTLVLQMARKGLDDGDPRRRMFDRGIASVGRMGTLIQDILAFARAGGEPEAGSANVRDAIDSVLEEESVAAGAARVDLVAEAPPGLDAACSSGVLASLVSNLVRNAVKYMGESPVRQVTVRAGRTGARVRVEVRDTGPGLPAGAEVKVFEPYVRADRTGQPGLGLGLATVKRLADAHHGAVGVASTTHGSVFWFELPSAAPSSEGMPDVQ